MSLVFSVASCIEAVDHSRKTHDVSNVKVKVGWWTEQKNPKKDWAADLIFLSSSSNSSIFRSFFVSATTDLMVQYSDWFSKRWIQNM